MTLMMQTTMEALYWMAITKFSAGLLVGLFVGLGIREVAQRWQAVRYG